jgi:serine/threonine protein kinase
MIQNNLELHPGKAVCAAGEARGPPSGGDLTRPKSPIGPAGCANLPSVARAFPRSFGKYTLLASLGRGGMGEVFAASLPLGAGGVEIRCVVKTLHVDTAADAEQVGRFLDEARLAVRLDHRNICRVFDVGIVDDKHYLAMELVRGRDARAIWKTSVEQKKSLAPGVVLHIMAEVLDGLDYAHQLADDLGQPLAIVHRDVSPQNVMVSFDGAVKLIDFGLAASTMKVERTETNIVLGKVPYMPPEQVRGERPDARADVFSVAVVLYELLTQKRYYDGVDPYNLPVVVASGVHLPSGFAELEPDLRAVLWRALQADRNRRTRSAGIFAEELRIYAQTHAVGADAQALQAMMADLFGVVREAWDQPLLPLSVTPAPVLLPALPSPPILEPALDSSSSSSSPSPSPSEDPLPTAAMDLPIDDLLLSLDQLEGPLTTDGVAEHTDSTTIPTPTMPLPITASASEPSWVPSSWPTQAPSASPLAAGLSSERAAGQSLSAHPEADTDTPMASADDVTEALTALPDAPPALVDAPEDAFVPVVTESVRVRRRFRGRGRLVAAALGGVAVIGVFVFVVGSHFVGPSRVTAPAEGLASSLAPAGMLATAVVDAGSEAVPAVAKVVVDAGPPAAPDAGPEAAPAVAAVVAGAGTAVPPDAGPEAAPAVAAVAAVVADPPLPAVNDGAAKAPVVAAPSPAGAAPARPRGSRVQVSPEVKEQAHQRLKRAAAKGDPAALLDTVRKVCGRSVCAEVPPGPDFAAGVTVCHERCLDFLSSL